MIFDPAMDAINMSLEVSVSFETSVTAWLDTNAAASLAVYV